MIFSPNLQNIIMRRSISPYLSDQHLLDKDQPSCPASEGDPGQGHNFSVILYLYGLRKRTEIDTIKVPGKFTCQFTDHLRCETLLDESLHAVSSNTMVGPMLEPKKLAE